MDDDFILGASVWDTPADVPVSKAESIIPAIASSSSPKDLFDDFDDFGPSTQSQDDDFGDFGDFGEAEELQLEPEFEQLPLPVALRDEYWEPLRLNPLPARAELVQQVNSILDPVWGTGDPSTFTTNEGIREVGGPSQILVTQESRDIYNMLFQTPPPTKPPNWTRSRIRRQHLIALGIPVNLDEVLPHMSGNKALPTLQITTRPMSAPPGHRNFPQQSGATTASAVNSRAGTPTPSQQGGKRPPTTFGPKPELDHGKIAELLDADPENLPLLPVAALERHLSDLRVQTASTSALLTHLLQTREVLQQDSETYNGLIADLVGEAQRQKMGKGKTNSRRGSGI